MKYQLFEVGGCVRDKILGRISTDIDYTVVIDSFDSHEVKFDLFSKYLSDSGHKVIISIPERFTIRTIPPNQKQIHDFVVAPTDLHSDIFRRDFTMNSLAIDENGEMIDLVGGISDIESKIIRCYENPTDILNSDPIRIFRAFRFSIQLNFTIDDSVWSAISQIQFENLRIDKLVDEMIKMFKLNSEKSLELFWRLREINLPLFQFVFQRVWLRTNLKKT